MIVFRSASALAVSPLARKTSLRIPSARVILGIETHRLIHVGQGLVILPTRGEIASAAQRRIGALGPQPNRFVELGNRQIRLPLL